MSDSDDSGSILPARGIPLDEMLRRLERDHARILVALLMYGTLTALEETRITVDTGYRVVLNWDVLLYFDKELKPRDRILAGALSHSVELGTINRHFGSRAVAPTCKRVKAQFASWWPKYLHTARSLGCARSKKIIFESEIPLDQLLVNLDGDRSRALITLLLYGALAAIEEGLITFDVAERAIMNRRVLLYCQEKLKPRDEVLEGGVRRCTELVAAARSTEQPDILSAFTDIKAKLARIIGTVTCFMANNGPGNK